MTKLNPHQEIQEDEYKTPYHWDIQKNTKKGVVYYGYWSLALASCGDMDGKTVLDAGCGDGFFSAQILKKNPGKLVGVDYSERAVSFAKEKVPGASFYVADLTDLPFEKGSFDVVFLIEVFEHIPKEKKPAVVAELSRVLTSGGRLIVSVPSVNLPVADKHEEHFTAPLLRKSFSPHFMLSVILGQDRGGTVGEFFWGVFRLWKNKYWHITPLTFFWTQVVYPLFMNRAPLQSANRYIATFTKGSA